MLGRNRTGDIQLPSWNTALWDPQSVQKSLDDLRAYAEAHAKAVLDWYFRNKRQKAWGSQCLRAFIIGATGAVPIGAPWTKIFAISRSRSNACFIARLL